MLNLLDKLTDLDNNRIRNFIQTWGVESGYKGNREYLADWAAAKPTLFHLLGGEIIHKVPISIEKSEDILLHELTMLYSLTVFKEKYRYELNKIFYNPSLKRNYIKMESADYYDMLDFALAKNFITNSISASFKYKKTEDAKLLQISRGMKPIKALQKVIKYFELEEELNDLLEQARIDISMVLNEKKLSGNLCFSIHPLDFITMSDNDSNWTSCMSWVKYGCYHVGTVETMNSNNTICCYLESSKPYCFSRHGKMKSEEYQWANKKWRQIVYVNKDIILGGKAYPYQNKEITMIILDELRKLAKKNWSNHTYQFGPELYRDMEHIEGIAEIDHTKEWIELGSNKKKNIIIDTKGMYNDFINDHSQIYWCVRNKVKSTKLICVSGKAKCLCCNNNVIYDNDDFYYEDGYNERFCNVKHVMCGDCVYDRTCDLCYSEDNVYGDLIVTDEGESLCRECYEAYLNEKENRL